MDCVRRGFVRHNAKATTRKGKKIELGFIRTEGPSPSKYTVKRMKREVTTGNRIFANRPAHKELASKTREESSRLDEKIGRT